jgi:hypothetical protein
VALTLNQTAKICSRSKSTLLDAIRSGRMSAPKDDRGRYVIDPAELHRAFPFQSQNRSPDQSTEPQPTKFENQSEPAELALKREIELLREMLGKAETNADHWRALAERQQALLENKRSREPRSFIQRILGR